MLVLLIVAWQKLQNEPKPNPICSQALLCRHDMNVQEAYEEAWLRALRSEDGPRAESIQTWCRSPPPAHSSVRDKSVVEREPLQRLRGVKRVSLVFAVGARGERLPSTQLPL